MKIIKKFKNGEYRYFVVDENDESKILDNANGYGYTSVRSATAAYSYKTRDKNMDIEMYKVVAWAKKNKNFVNFVDTYHTDDTFYAMKSGIKAPIFNEKYIRNIIKLNPKYNSVLDNLNFDMKYLLKYLRGSRKTWDKKAKNFLEGEIRHQKNIELSKCFSFKDLYIFKIEEIKGNPRVLIKNPKKDNINKLLLETPIRPNIEDYSKKLLKKYILDKVKLVIENYDILNKHWNKEITDEECLKLLKINNITNDPNGDNNGK